MAQTVNSFFPFQVLNSVFSTCSNDVFLLVLWKQGCPAKGRKHVDFFFNCWRPSQLLHACSTSMEIPSTLLQTRHLCLCRNSLLLQASSRESDWQDVDSEYKQKLQLEAMNQNVLVLLAGVHSPIRLSSEAASIKAIGVPHINQ